MNKVILLIGGNEGHRLDNILMATQMIVDGIGDINYSSSLYESEPWGFSHQQNFLNQVIELSTALSAFDILDKAKQIEAELGRKPKTQQGYEGRTMDIDILFFNEERIKSEHLIVPHPKLHERLFTLLPLAEGWSTIIHPTLKKTMSELLKECEDKGWVEKIPGNFTKESGDKS